ncbi:NAD(P)-binding protein [Apiospora sp. TS-2023a]
MRDKQARSAWSGPQDVAAAMYHIVSRGRPLPIHVPLGHDAWGTIMLDIENIKKDLDELKPISTCVGLSEQLKSIDFLKS